MKKNDLPYPENLISAIGIPKQYSDGKLLPLNEDQKKGLSFVLDKFLELPRLIITYRYEQHMSYDEIAVSLHRTKERILFIHRKILKELQLPKWSVYIRDGYEATLKTQREEAEKHQQEVGEELRLIEQQLKGKLSSILIADMAFPVRVVNALKHSNISTLKDLLEWLLNDTKKTQRIRGLGKKSWEIINNRLNQYGIKTTTLDKFSS